MHAGIVIVDWFYDPAVKGPDPVTSRPGFTAMLNRIAHNGVGTILIESPDRFARDLAVQLAGHDFLRGMDVTLIPATAPDFFLEDTTTAVLVRQVLREGVASREAQSGTGPQDGARHQVRRPQVLC